MGLFFKKDSVTTPPDAVHGHYDAIPIATAVLVPSAPPASASVATSAPVTQAAVAHPELRVTFELGRNPVQMICPHCNKNIATRTKTFPNWLTWFAVVGATVIFWPIFFVPLVLDQAKKTEHYCTNCHEIVGTVQPFSDCCVTQRG